MIKYFAVENFYSIKDKQEMHFDVNLPKDSKYPAYPLIGIAGANASGKTNVLRALRFCLWFMQSSFRELSSGDTIPFEPYLSNPYERTKFNIEFCMRSIDNSWIEFEYSLHLVHNEVYYEELNMLEQENNVKIYRREFNNIEIGSSIRLFDTDNIPRHCSIVSYAAQFKTQEIAQWCQSYTAISNVFSSGMETFRYRPDQIIKNLNTEKDRINLVRAFQIADVGIQDITSKVSLGKMSNLANKLRQIKEDGSRNLSNEEIDFIKALEEVPTDKLFEVQFVHKIGNLTYKLNDNQESSGTLQFIILFDYINQVLRKGGGLIHDEIELSLHPNLVAYLLGLFKNPHENKKGAQLIFSFHNTAFMEFLEPEELWFTEKNDQGQTEVYTASDFKDIKDLHKKNLEKLYRMGLFGAQPRGL